MQTLNTDIQSLGGGMGGFGMGGGTNPLLWLITLAFLGGDRGLLGGRGGDAAGAGVLAGETQAKLDCLAQGQGQLADQLRQQTNVAAFQGINDQLVNLAGIQRDQTTFLASQINDLSRQNAECCCELKTGQQAIRTDIAMQTNTLERAICDGNQRIVDLINANTLSAKDQRISELEQQSQTATLAAIIRDQCGGKSNGVSLDQLLAVLASNGKATA